LLSQEDNNISSSQDLKEKDFFQGVSERVRLKREEHIKRTLEWANKKKEGEGGDDVEMEDVSMVG
jgi:hypothetical protein